MMPCRRKSLRSAEDETPSSYGFGMAGYLCNAVLCRIGRPLRKVKQRGIEATSAGLVWVNCARLYESLPDVSTLSAFFRAVFRNFATHHGFNGILLDSACTDHVRRFDGDIEDG